jgi:DNA primase catalytic subunit
MTLLARWRGSRERRVLARRRRALRAYYATAPLWLPPRPTFRQFRVAVDRPGRRTRFLKIDDRVKNAETLRGWLVRLAPAHVYFTTSRWLDPQRLGPRDLRGRKAGYPIAHNILLGQELYFDIDAPGDLDAAKEDASALLQFLREEGLDDLRLVYSGNKGFHVHAYDFERKFLPRLPEDPRKREAAVQGARVDLVTRIVNEGIGIDVDVTMDPRRILRLPGSVHGRTFNICEFVPAAGLGRFQPTHLPQ